MRENNHRDKLFHHFVDNSGLHPIDIGHKTYHHFVGEGKSDSAIDVLLESDRNSEVLSTIYCSKEDPSIDSHHDPIISHVT